MNGNTDFYVQGERLVRYKGSGDDVVIPTGITVIGRSAFAECAGLRSVTIPDGVAVIERYAFQNCEELHTVTIPDSVTRIEESVFDDCKNLKNIRLPKTLGVIENCLFRGCNSLSNLQIPESVTKIGSEAFLWCEGFTEILIPENVNRIEGSAFVGCKKLKTVTIPQNVKFIGDGVFNGCEELSEINVSEENPNYASVEGILYDRKNGVLMKAPCGTCGSITVPEGTAAITARAFSACRKLQEVILPQSLTAIGNFAFSGCWELKEITIPAGVKNIGNGLFEWTRIEKIVVRGEMPEFGKKNAGAWMTPTLEFPDLILTKRDKIAPALGVGACIKTAEEYAYVWRFQSGKTWDGVLDKASVEAKEVVKVFGQLLPDDAKLTSSQWNRMVSYLELNAHNLDKTVVLDFLKTVEQKDKKAVAKFMSNTAIAGILSAEDTEDQHPVEKRVKELLHVTSEYTAVLKALSQGIRYADSDIVCAPMVAAFVISEYMKLYDPDSVRFVSAYKTMCQAYRILPEVDEIAARLDRGQLLEVLQELAFRNGGAYSLPYARYADETHAAALITQMNKWDNWGMYAATGRKNIIIARSGLLLSDTKAAMLRLDKDQCLKWYARMRGVDESVLRDTVLSDFGFDEEKKIRWDLGKSAVSVAIGPDLQLYLTDEKTGKTVRSVPKKDADPDLYQKVKTEISALKKNVKKVILNRRDTLFRQFLDGEQKNAADWKAVYLKNPVLRAVAQLIVWSQEDQTFTLTDSGAVDCRGGEYCIGDGDIGVAHPVQMKPEEVAAWQNYFLARGLKQPFEQIWEPAYKPEDIREDRYEGAEISVYRVMGKEVHGIDAYGMVDYSEEYGFELTDCKLEHEGSEYRFTHGQDCLLTLGKFTVTQFTRYANHIIYLFDKWTISDRIARDDVSVAGLLHSFTLHQITEFMKIAEENYAVSVKAILMDHKNKYFPDADPMAIFVLD